MSEIINSLLKTVIKGTKVTFTGMVASTLLWFATKVLIIRNTTKEELGIYSIVAAVAGVLSVLAGLGLQDGVARYISIYLGEGRKVDAESVSATAVKTGIISGTVFSLLLFLLSDIVAGQFFYKPELGYPLKVISFFVFFSVAANIMGGILRGNNIIGPKVYLFDIAQPFYFLLMLCLFLFLGMPFISVIYAYMFSVVIVSVSIGIYCFRKIGPGFFLLRGGYDRELIRFSTPLLLATVLGLVLVWSDTLMLGRYARAEDVGVYNVSTSLARLLIFPLGAIEFAFMPIAGEMYARRQQSELKRTYQVLTKWNFAATLPVFFVLFFFPEMTITFLFGPNFTDSSMPLRILSVGFLLNAFLGANGMLMIIMGRARDLMNFALIVAFLNVLLNYVLIKHYGYGAIGAAVATLISYFVINALISLSLYRISGIHPLTLKYVRPLAGAALTGMVIYLVAKNLPLYFWMLPLYFLLFIGGYLISLFLTGSLDSEDVLMFDAISTATGIEMSALKKIILARSGL